jgi:hypothetical protein
MNYLEQTAALKVGVRERIYPLFRELGFKRTLRRPKTEGRHPLQLQYSRPRDPYADQIEILWRSYQDPSFTIEWMTSQVERMAPKFKPDRPLPGRIYRSPKPFFSGTSEMAWFRWGKDLDAEFSIVDERVRELDAYLREGRPMKFIFLG